MSLWGAAVEHVLFPAWEGRLRGRPTLERLAFLERTQRRSLDELHAIQAGELRRLLRHAFEHVPLYRARFEAAGVRPEEIRGPEDLARLPVLTREEAMDSARTRRSTAPPLPTIRKTTSGSTGQPLAFAYDPGSEYWRQAVKLRGYGWASHRIGRRTLYYWGAPIVPPPPLATRAKVAVDHFLKRERYVDCTQRSSAGLDRLVRTIRRDRPDVIVCFAMSGAALARHVVATGARTWGDIPVIAAAERLWPADREALEAAFGRCVFETYGSREVMLIAAECEAHDGLHCSMENLVVELLVEEDGRSRPARPGEAGDVVITDLHNFGMPFIRYRNGDRALAGPASRCACGRSLVRLGGVEGRVTDALRLPDGTRVSGLVFNVIFAVLGAHVRQFQAVQHRDGAITLRLVRAASFTDGTRAAILDNCARHLPGVPLRIEQVDDIPLSPSGKRRVVVVEK